MVVQHNIPAMNANRYFGINNSGLSKSLEKLSSGYAINRAGDNAAGLAVSEKMRSQIAGLTQGVKNAQDGISMVQTYEGALTETDAILQRMKTLADQSANGTYQDDVDRDAIQLEFDQLNDELNQIADTDFNGVVVLNGGEMSDGTKAHNGKFDYSTKQADIMQAAKDMFRSQMADANNAIKEANEAMASKNFDLSANGDAPEWQKGSLDNNLYDKTAADVIWKNLGITDNKLTTGNVDTSTVTDLDVTFKYDKASKTWKVDAATDNTGKEYDKADLEKVFKNATGTGTTVGIQPPSTITAAGGVTPTPTFKGNGGFDLQIGGTATTVKAIFDETNVKDGDTVTLKFTNGANTKLSPNHIGFSIDSLDVENTSANAADGDQLKDTDFKVLLGKDGTSAIGDSQMTDAYKAAYEGLKGLNVELTYKETNGKTAGNDLLEVKLGDTKLSMAGAGNDKANAYTFSYKGKEYKAMFADDMTGATTNHKLYIFKKGDETDDAAKALMTIDFKTVKAETGANTDDGTKGTAKFNIALSTPEFVDSSASIRVDPSENKALGTSKEFQDALTAAKDKLAKLGEVDISSYESAKEYLIGNGVSVSDAMDQATAPLTYTDHVMLQAGARSKDLVDFTFKYASGGMGDLKANMNCSAREDGLGTANLNLKTAKDANYAIDRIDNAINKVSMVRATFGAVQNRLEHKIDNMNVTKENMTSAESRIRDTNMAEEMTNFTKNQILSQASQAMLAQANQLPQGVLQLLG